MPIRKIHIILALYLFQPQPPTIQPMLPLWTTWKFTARLLLLLLVLLLLLYYWAEDGGGVCQEEN